MKERVTKKWIEEYFGLSIPTKEYSSFWKTDGGKGTFEYDALNEEEYDRIYQSNSKTYWGKLK